MATFAQPFAWLWGEDKKASAAGTTDNAAVAKSGLADDGSTTNNNNNAGSGHGGASPNGTGAGSDGNEAQHQHQQLVPGTAVTAAAAAHAAAQAAAAVQPRKSVAGHSVAAVSVAASVEGFYRSAMNAQINRVLTRTRGPLFPRMHVQLPVRVLYINGFKGLRHVIEERVRPEAYGPGLAPAVRAAMAIAPGLIMTPVSSVLEACNANLNPEPLHLRATRGFVARGGREVIFGIGLNQLSDELGAFAPASLPAALKPSFGSLTAGVVAAFFSHVPHNLSTLKLMNPSKSYGQLFDDFAKPWRKRLETRFPWMGHGTRGRVAGVISCVAPTGLGVRTLQVVGSFVILNGIISLFPVKGGASDREEV